jgi:Mce-associated membrane protein
MADDGATPAGELNESTAEEPQAAPPDTDDGSTESPTEERAAVKPEPGSADIKTDDLKKEPTSMPVDTEATANEITESTAETDSAGTEAHDGQESDAGGSVKTRPDVAGPAAPVRRIRWSRVFIFGVLPGLALLLAMGAGFLKWHNTSIHDSDIAGIESVQAAKDSTVALLSYQPDKVEQQLDAAKDLLTGQFLDSYTSLINQVVIPGAKQQHISTVATVPAAAPVSATENHAVVLVFVNQAATIGNGAPSNTTSSVKVTMDKIGGRWLISGFDPV